MSTGSTTRGARPAQAEPEPEPSAARAAPLLRPRGSNQVGMRQFNERVVLQAIRQNGSLPKADLARLTSLTAQTIGLITARLEHDGLLIRNARVRGRIGQPSVPLALNPDGAFAIGVNIGRLILRGPGPRPKAIFMVICRSCASLLHHRGSRFSCITRLVRLFDLKGYDECRMIRHPRSIFC